MASLRPGSLIGGCTVGLAISWNIANTGAVATLLARHYRTSLAVIGLLTTVLFFAELAVMIPGGQAIDRYGAKRVGLVALMVSLVGNLLLLNAAAPLLALVLRGLTGLGVGAGFLAGAIYVQFEAGRGAALAGGIYGGVALGAALLALSLSMGADVVGAALAGLAAGIPFGATLVGATRTYPRAAGAAVGAMNVYPIVVIVCGAPLVGLTFSLPGAGRIGFAALAGLALAAIAAIPHRLRLA